MLRYPVFVRRVAGAILALTTLLVMNSTAQEPTASRGRRINNAPVAEATVTINEQFVNSFLNGIFDNLREPSVPLSSGAEGCASEIRLKREVGGVRTAIHFENGRVVGPLAFAGAYYSSLLGCVEFTGWADSEVNLSFDSKRRALIARFHLREIHLNDMPALANGPVLSLVQSTIDRRYNPVEVLTLDQISTLVNIPQAGGALRLRATDIRPEVTPGGLALHVSYEFVRG